MPVLGVCLGMQALAVAHGAAVQHAPYPVHGNLSGITHSGHPLFAGIPSGKWYPPWSKCPPVSPQGLVDAAHG